MTAAWTDDRELPRRQRHALALISAAIDGGDDDAARRDAGGVGVQRDARRAAGDGGELPLAAVAGVDGVEPGRFAEAGSQRDRCRAACRAAELRLRAWRGFAIEPCRRRNQRTLKIRAVLKRAVKLGAAEDGVDAPQHLPRALRILPRD